MACAPLVTALLVGCGDDAADGMASTPDAMANAASWNGEPGRLWASNSLRNSISEVDTRTGISLHEHDISSVGNEPGTVDACNGSVWFRTVGALGRIAPDGSVEDLDNPTYELVCGDGSVWVNNNDLIERFDASSGAKEASIEVDALLYPMIAFGAGSAWALDGLTVYRIDATTNSVSAEIALPSGLRRLTLTTAMAFGEGALWLLDAGPNQSLLVKIDPATDTAVAHAEVPTADATADVAAGFGSVWVSSAWDGSETDNRVFAIDPDTLEVTDELVLEGAAPSTLELGGSFLYVYATFSTGAFSYERRIYKLAPDSKDLEWTTLVATEAGYDAIAQLAFEAE